MNQHEGKVTESQTIRYSGEIRRKEEAQERADELSAKLLDLGWDPERIEDFRLAVAEGLVNAAKHGNKDNPEKTVNFSVDITPDEARVVITDQGEGFDPDSVPDPHNEAGLIRESGRGILLMKHYTDEHEYSDGGRTLTLVKRRE